MLSSCFQISCLAQGKDWDEKTSSAQNYIGNVVNTSSNYSNSSYSNSSYQSNSDNYQANGGYQNYNSDDIKYQKEEFFNRKMNENSTRSEYVASHSNKYK